ncbi:MAG: Ycf51 family protein [Microcoleaceae cyanobacterium]
MLDTGELLEYSKWFGIATLGLAVITGIGFLFNWGFRFRLVGVTAFTGVLTAGIFGLGLGLLTRTEIPGSVQYTRVYDDGARQIVLRVSPEITETQVEATLQEAAANLFSPGRVGRPGEEFKIRVRTLIHPQPGVSQPVYLGEVKRIATREGGINTEIELFPEAIATLQAANGEPSSL